MEVKININWVNYEIKDLSTEVSKILIKMLSIKEESNKIYFWSWFHRYKEFKRTWEFRQPLAWEYYLSWAKAEVYQAFHNLGSKFHIVKKD